jgi:hypothetical protein
MGLPRPVMGLLYYSQQINNKHVKYSLKFPTESKRVVKLRIKKAPVLSLIPNLG